MFRLCFLTLANAVLVLSRVKPEPPETNFFLVSIPLHSGLQSSVVFFTNSHSTRPEPLCLHDDNEGPESSNISLLAHKLCTDSKFTISIQAYFVKPNSTLGYNSENSSSELSCSQDDFYEIVCNRSSSRIKSCSLLQVTCGACHSHVNLQPSSSLQLVSPLYPVLQPGLVCQYDLQLPQGTGADISIEIADLSLAPAKASHSGKHCVSSFLHILKGESFSGLESVATLCGEVYYPVGSSYFNLSSSVVRLILVAGSDDMAWGRRGFLVNVHVSSSRLKIPLRKLYILLSLLGFLVIIGVIFSCVLLFLNRKSKSRVSHPRRRQTWHGSVARPGESLHQARTERIRQFGSWGDRSSWGRDNLYMFDNRVSRRLPQLPAFNFASYDQNNREEDEDPGFKVYESLSLKSKSSESILNEAIANANKKFSSSSSQCPPPLPSRPSPKAEDPYSSPLYLSLPGCYNNSWGQDVESGVITPTQAVGDVFTATDDVGDSRFPAEPGHHHHGGRQKVNRHGLSVLMNRIRSISVTECSEDEAILIEGSVDDDGGDEVF